MTVPGRRRGGGDLAIGMLAAVHPAPAEGTRANTLTESPSCSGLSRLRTGSRWAFRAARGGGDGRAASSPPSPPSSWPWVPSPTLRAEEVAVAVDNRAGILVAQAHLPDGQPQIVGEILRRGRPGWAGVGQGFSLMSFLRDGVQMAAVFGCQFKQVVDRPLVVGVFAVLGGQDAAVGRDQEVGRKAEPPTGLRAGRRTLLPAEDPPRTTQNGPGGWRPGARAQQCSRCRLDAELGVQALGGIGYDGEGELGHVIPQFLGGRVEDHNLADSSVSDLFVSSHHRLKVQVADRAAGEPPELKMCQPVTVGHSDRGSRDGREVMGTDNGTGP